MQITKFKYAKNGNISVEFKELKRTDGDKEIWARVKLVSNEKVHNDLSDCLVLLRPFVISMLELPEKETQRISVTGALFTETPKEGIFGAQLFALRRLDHSDIPQEVVTPHKTEVPYSDQENVEPALLLDEECVQILRQLQAEAELYVRNHKDQVGIFNGTTYEDQENDQEQGS